MEEMLKEVRRLRARVLELETEYNEVRGRYLEAVESYKKAVAEYEELDKEMALTDGRLKRYKAGYKDPEKAMEERIKRMPKAQAQEMLERLKTLATKGEENGES